jgi:hypothetical protein
MAVSLVFAGCKPQATPSPLSASLSELTGTVEMKQAGQDNFTPAAADAPLQVNGQIQTGDDGRVRLDLSSGTIIRVAPSSLFTLISNDEVEGGLATKIKLQLGKVFIILNGGSADVETPSGVASVKGSYMKVEVDPETQNVYVTCLEGDCNASNEAGSVGFTRGERTILFAKDPVTGDWTVPVVGPMTPEEFQEWLDENPEAKEVYNQAMGTLTAMAVPPTETPTSTPTLEAALPPTEASSACFKIIGPASGSGLPKIGKVTFSWESQPAAQNYVVTITDVFGNSARLETTGTSVEKYVEILPNGGDYEWFVTAFNADGKEICSTGSNSFSKPQGDPTAKPTKEPEAPDAPVCTEYNYICQDPCVDPYYSSTNCN